MPKPDKYLPTATQAAQMEPAGPDREALLDRADHLFAARGGAARLRAVAILQRTMEQYSAGLEARAKDPEAPMIVGVREGLRAALAIDKAYASIDALMEQCVQQAREEFYRHTKRRIAEQIWTFEVDTPPVIRGGNAAAELKRAMNDQIAKVEADLAEMRGHDTQPEPGSKARPEPLTQTHPPAPSPAPSELSKLLMDKYFQGSVIQAPGKSNGNVVTKS